MKGEVAVLIPCYNEELTVGKVVDEFRKELPQANIYVFDNNSKDRTAEIALEHGAKVVRVPKQGKGHAVQAMFDKIEADYYVMVDGDDTYPAKHVHDLLAPLKESCCDMVVGSRFDAHHAESFRPFHRFGNDLVANLIRWIWTANLRDIMSGYRAFNSNLARSLPLITSGFEIETEMTLQALDKGFLILERPITYGVRPQGSFSKLNTVRDGLRVVFLILRIFKDYKPLTFFGSMGICCGLLSLIPGYSIFKDVVEGGTEIPIGTAITFGVCALLSVLSIHIGLILNSLSWKLREIYSVIRRNQTKKVVFSSEVKKQWG
ncbi:MAG: glycosyltransferase [Acidobacteria bacterium]|nr:glycosyltransferase [Acidobacteriota bacterium]